MTTTCPFHARNNSDELSQNSGTDAKRISRTSSDGVLPTEYTPFEVIRALELTQQTFIDRSLTESHTAYIQAMAKFMEHAFEKMVSDIQKYEHFSGKTSPFSKVLKALERVKDFLVPDAFLLTIRKSVSPEDWKYMARREYSEMGAIMIDAAKNFGIPEHTLYETLQGGWENAVGGMFEVFSRAQAHAKGDKEMFDEYCKSSEKFLLRLAATSISVHSILMIDRKRIIHERSGLDSEVVSDLKTTFISAAGKKLPKRSQTENTEQVAAFAKFPRSGCPALHAKTTEGESYILTFFHLFQQLYKERFF